MSYGILWLALTFASAQETPCPQTTDTEDFLQSATEGERAFAAMDLPALRAARDEALRSLSCLGAKLTPRDAAAFHRMMALAAFTTGDRDQVLAEFHAARRLEPGYEIPEAVAPVGHPLVQLYDLAVDAAEGTLEPPLPPLSGYVMVDGVRGAPRPNGISTVIQVYDGEVLQETRLLMAGERMPSWGPSPLEEHQRRRQRRAVLVGAIGTAALAGSLSSQSTGRGTPSESPSRRAS